MGFESYGALVLMLYKARREREREGGRERGRMRERGVGGEGGREGGREGEGGRGWVRARARARVCVCVLRRAGPHAVQGRRERVCVLMLHGQKCEK